MLWEHQESGIGNDIEDLTWLWLRDYVDSVGLHILSGWALASDITVFWRLLGRLGLFRQAGTVCIIGLAIE